MKAPPETTARCGCVTCPPGHDPIADFAGRRGPDPSGRPRASDHLETTKSNARAGDNMGCFSPLLSMPAMLRVAGKFSAVSPEGLRASLTRVC
jgi:hypothetical protein